MGVMKTPGVYIVEKSAFPNSVVEVAPAGDLPNPDFNLKGKGYLLNQAALKHCGYKRNFIEHNTR